MPDNATDLTPVTPGDLMTLNCPAGTTVPLRVGEVLSRDEKGQATSKVIRIEENSIVLGALRAGEIHIAIECPGSPPQKVSGHFQITPLKKEEMPEAAAPLAPLTFTYPLWFWMLLALGLVLLAGLTWGIYRKLHKRFAPPPKDTTPRRASPSEAFAEFLAEVDRSKLDEKSDPESVQLLYSQGYERLRKFIEHHYDLKTVIETTREFLGSLRAAAPKVGLPAESVNAIEGLLTVADRVRFAKEVPPIEERRNFNKRLHELQKALRPRENPAPSNKDFR